MSGVKRLAQLENKGLDQVTNEDLKEEGYGSSVEDAKEDTKENE